MSELLSFVWCGEWRVYCVRVVCCVCRISLLLGSITFYSILHCVASLVLIFGKCAYIYLMLLVVHLHSIVACCSWCDCNLLRYYRAAASPLKRHTATTHEIQHLKDLSIYHRTCRTFISGIYSMGAQKENIVVHVQKKEILWQIETITD